MRVMRLWLGALALVCASCGSSDKKADGATGGTGGGGSGCTVTPMATQSANISTVFTVSFTTSLPSFDSAEVNFGLDTSYGFTAPVTDNAAAKAVLLGMKEQRAYHYRVTVK